ncbi:hypothetical protein [Sporosarcina sp. Te-1]|uniref:hypothetical protein n=1 Tax=Sporosarcina sp. Te-1 TaxID=2818390 RepID=UPI001A9DCB83|nr:hypothetical protein [Sporosarcina sp. Te-1]QTD41235.1 hypothetical protein J3U78_21365 [Sporosarcina sp. Te-1]
MIRFQKPLLFVQGPPVYTRIIVSDEESTSVFVMIEDGKSTMEDAPEYDITPVFDGESLPSDDNDERPSHPVIFDTLHYLNNPFRRQVYRPLQFYLKEEQVKGSLRKVEGDIIWIDPLEGGEGPVKLVINEIESIHWRGQPFIMD